MNLDVEEISCMQSKGTPVVALRTDMDALPIQEDTNLPFASTHQGKMHACGHDSHMAMLLGATKVLKENEGQLKGTVKLVFQPAEEGGGGALQILKEGGLKDVERIYGIHVWPTLDSGTLNTRQGPFMAAANLYDIKVEGVGGHAAMPHLTKDPIVATADIITSLQKIVSREVSPIDNAVITVTAVDGGTAYNVIPDYVHIKGTVRSLNQDIFQNLLDRITEISQSVALAHRCNATVKFRDFTYPVVNNDKDAHEEASYVAAQIFGKENINTNVEPSATAEDFGFYTQEIKGAFNFLGVGNKAKGLTHGLHTSKFTVDEDQLYKGAAFHAALAINYLNKGLSIDNQKVNEEL